MSLITIIFYFFISLAAVSAIGILMSKNVFKATLLLLVCLLSVAALFVIAFAEFVATTQVLIYAGGVLVVILFGIMLTTKFSGKALIVGNKNIFSGLLASTAILILLLNFMSTYTLVSPPQSMSVSPSLQTIGINLMTTFALPFEIAGVLLLIALIGAAVTASFTKPKKI